LKAKKAPTGDLTETTEIYNCTCPSKYVKSMVTGGGSLICQKCPDGEYPGPGWECKKCQDFTKEY